MILSILMTGSSSDPLGVWDKAPVDWPPLSLWSLAKYSNGAAFKPSDVTARGRLIIKITELKVGLSTETKRYDGDVKEEQVIHDGDLLFAWSGNPETSLDTFWWRGEEAVLNQHIFKVTPRPGVDKDYLYYLLRFLRPVFVRTARDKATSMGHVKVSDLKRLVAHVPSADEQRAIAGLLRPLDAKVEMNHRTNHVLEQTAEALFRSWFVNFDPVRAKAEGRWKEGENLPGMPADMWELWPSRFEESEIGEIPTGWKVQPLNEVATITRGVSYRGEDLADSETALVNLKCAGRGGLYRADGLKAYRGPFKEEQVVQADDVVVSHTDVTQRAEVIGRAYRVLPSERYTRMVASLDMAIVRPRLAGQTREYLAYALSDERFHDHAYGYINGTTVLHLSSQALPDYPHLMPHSEIVRQFSDFAASVHQTFNGLALQSSTLAKVRDALLPKLLSGEIRVCGSEVQ